MGNDKFSRDTVVTDELVTGYRTKRHEVVVGSGISESLLSGELTCLLGPNGAGKSTILKTLSGYIPPLGGNIRIAGRDLGDYSEKELAKVIGVVLTDRPGAANMTAEELIGLGRSPYTGFWGSLSADDKKIVDEAISLMNINNLRHRHVDTLSDGERQKVMIAKTLAQETPVIFLDEPTAFLDFPSKVEILRLLKYLSREKHKTIFLSTHDLEIALQIADKVWLLDKNIGLISGTPQGLAADGSIARYFNREGLTFNASTGLFNISDTPAK